jgi:hypothetical protein
LELHNLLENDACEGDEVEACEDLGAELHEFGDCRDLPEKADIVELRLLH